MAFRAALEENTRERVPLYWARTQYNLGSALATLGERESDMARLEQAVGPIARRSRKVPRERVPLDWARSFGGQGVALVLIGDRTTAGAEIAVSQIETAYEALRASGDEASLARLEARLTRARAIRDRLTSVTKP
jgi:hypothetical protein